MTAEAPSVIVVGAGPVGVVAGLLLVHRGFEVTIFERDPEIYDLPRAIVMDDEIQRVVGELGLLEGLQAITTPLAGAEFVSVDGSRIIGAESPPPEETASGLAPRIVFYQPELEAFLRRAALDAGVDIHVSTTVTSVDDTGDRVTAFIIGPDGNTETRTADWLIAADGAASPIRKALGIEFVDQGFDQGWLVVDVELTNPDVGLPRLAQQICDPERPTTFVPGHGSFRRWEFQLQDGESRDDMTEPDRVWQLLEPWLRPSDARLIRAVVYRFHATVAARMRAGRIFLAGDAAHQMPPFLGQGLCSGLRDAANLAWKLAMVEAGVADDRLLDSYDQERRPHAAGVVAHAVEAGRLIDQLSGREPRSIGIDAAYGGQRPFPRLESGVLVGTHRFVGRQVPQPRVGADRLDRLLGSGFTVIVVDPDVAEPVRDRWRRRGGTVLPVPDGALGDLVAPTGALVVRPDRYVAAVCTDQTELVAATDRLLATIGTP